MNELMPTNGKTMMSSREIAELTGKLHKNVLVDIDKLIVQGVMTRLNFQPSTYLDSSKPRVKNVPPRLRHYYAPHHRIRCTPKDGQRYHKQQ